AGVKYFCHCPKTAYSSLLPVIAIGSAELPPGIKCTRKNKPRATLRIGKGNKVKLQIEKEKKEGYHGEANCRHSSAAFRKHNHLYYLHQRHSAAQKTS
ncbi:MAG: hypothetical protein QHH75_09475, partial [Bacillota bacterium]|nr:hypothetical protein [Bacillota bacterium]